MYSEEERMKAIKLFLKYDKRPTKTVRELGYPGVKALLRWYAEYVEEKKTGISRNSKLSASRYSMEEKNAAMDYYVAHGRSLTATVEAMGYPTVTMLYRWCDQYRPGVRKVRGCGIICSKEQKEEAVFRLLLQEASAEELAAECDVSPQTIRSWQRKMLGKENYTAMRKEKNKLVPREDEAQISDSQSLKEGNETLARERDALLKERDALKKELQRAEMQMDILKEASKVIKKDRGIDLKNLSNKEKTAVIDALRNKYPLKELLQALHMACSSYHYHHSIASRPEKHEKIRDRIKELFQENRKTYGYRRIHSLLQREGHCLSEKIVRRIMKECGLIVYVKKKKPYSSYKGDNLPGAKNLVQRNFHAGKPNEKWLTDITEFALPGGKVYLSPIVDCFDGFLRSWTIGTSPNAKLVNDMLDKATSTLTKEEKPLVHSDQGGQYRGNGWVERMTAAELQRSMSRKGYCPDNSACEGVFGRIKNEMFYNRKWQGVSTDSFVKILDDYLVWYNTKRIKMSLGGMSPLEYRQSLNLPI